LEEEFTAIGVGATAVPDTYLPGWLADAKKTPQFVEEPPSKPIDVGWDGNKPWRKPSPKPIDVDWAKRNPFYGPLNQRRLDDMLNRIKSVTKAEAKHLANADAVPMECRASLGTFLEEWEESDKTHDRYLSHVPPGFDEGEAIQMGDLLFWLALGGNARWNTRVKQKKGVDLHDLVGLHAELINYLPQNWYNQYTLHELFFKDETLREEFDQNVELTATEHDALQALTVMVKAGNMDALRLSMLRLKDPKDAQKWALDRSASIGTRLAEAFEMARRATAAYANGDFASAHEFLDELEEHYGIPADAVAQGIDDLFIIVPHGGQTGGQNTPWLVSLIPPLPGKGAARYAKKSLQEIHDIFTKPDKQGKSRNLRAGGQKKGKKKKKGGGGALNTDWQGIFTEIYGSGNAHAETEIRFIKHADMTEMNEDFLPKAEIIVQARGGSVSQQDHKREHDDDDSKKKKQQKGGNIAYNIIVQDYSGAKITKRREERATTQEEKTLERLEEADPSARRNPRFAVEEHKHRGSIVWKAQDGRWFIKYGPDLHRKIGGYGTPSRTSVDSLEDGKRRIGELNDKHRLIYDPSQNPKASKGKKKAAMGNTFFLELMPRSSIKVGTMKQSSKLLKQWGRDHPELRPMLEKFAKGGANTGSYMAYKKGRVQLVVLNAVHKGSNKEVPYAIRMPRMMVTHRATPQAGKEGTLAGDLVAKKGSGMYFPVKKLLEVIEANFGPIKFIKDTKGKGGWALQKGDPGYVGGKSRTGWDKTRVTEGVAKIFRTGGLKCPSCARKVRPWMFASAASGKLQLKCSEHGLMEVVL